MKKITIKLWVVLILLSITCLPAQTSFEGSENYGRLTDLTYDQNTQGKIYGLTLGNHIMVSNDNGTTWEVLYSFPENGTSIKGLKNLGEDKLSFYVVNTSNQLNHTIYVYNINSDEVSAINPPSEVADKVWVNSYAINEEDSDVVLFDMGFRIGLANFSKVFYSRDGGVSWEEVYFNMNNDEVFVNNVAINPADPDKIYILLGIGPNDLEGGLLYSDDGGETWTEKLSGQSLKAISFDPSDGDHIWLGTATGYNTTVQNLYESNDAGESWVISPIAWDDYFLEEINYIAINPINPDHVVVLEANEIVITTDGGVNWTNIVYDDDPESYYYGLKAVYNPFQSGEMLINSDYYPLISTDGGMTVNRIYNPFFNASSVSVSTLGDGHLFYGVQRGLVHKNLNTLDENSYYVQPINFFFSDPPPVYSVDPNIEGRVYMFLDGFSGELTMYSNDFGATFTPIKQTFFDRLLHITTDPGNSNGVVVSYENAGTEYIEFSSSPVASPLSMPSANYHWTTYIDPSDSSFLLAGIGGEIYKSTDGTGSWTNVSTGLNLDPTQDQIFQIERNPSNINEYLVATSAGLFKSTNQGNTWSQVYGGTNVGKIAYSTSDDGVVIAGVYSYINTDARLLYSNDGGDSWQSLPSDVIANAGTRSMDFSFEDGIVNAFVATYDLGLLKASISINSLSVEGVNLEDSSISVFPNPTKYQLNIKLPNNIGVTKVNVFNMLGELIMSSDQSRITVQNLKPQMYLIEILDTDGNIHINRFMKE